MNTPKTKAFLKEFQCVLNSISQELTDDDITGLKFLLLQHLPGGPLEKSKDGKDIFSMMQTSGNLSYENTKTLINLLEEIKRVDLTKKLTEFDRALRLSKSVPYNIKKEKLISHFKETEKSRMLKENISGENVVTVYGPLGAGKSQNAIWVGVNHQKNNPDAVVWYCRAKNEASLITSLRCLIDEMATPSTTPLISESEDVETTITILCDELKDRLYQRRVPSSYHLIIIDDVATDCCKMVQKIVNSFVSTEENNTRFIVTTRNKLILNDYCKLHMNGFTPEESMAFLAGQEDEDVRNEDRICQYKTLADTMSNLPLGLYTARTYMQNMSIGPQYFLELLEEENIDSIDQQLKDMNLESDEITLFTAIKFYIYSDFQENVRQDVFEMFQMTQFLDTEDIPIVLLEYVFRNNGHGQTMLLSNFLVQAIQKRSLGVIEGEDDNRRLSVHGVVTMTLDMCTSDTEKRSLLKKLVWGFALLMDKDVFHNKDLNRLKLLIPHARATLKHIEKLGLTSDYDVLVLTTFVYDLVGYGYNYGRFKLITMEYSEKAKNSCFELLSLNEQDIDVEIKNSLVSVDENDISFYIEFSKKKANIVWQQLEASTNVHWGSLDRLVPRFVVQRFRVDRNKELLATFLNLKSSDVRINSKLYESLVPLNLALPIQTVKSYFLHELLLAVFYTYGRQINYMGSNIEVSVARKYLRYLYLAKELGHRLKAVQGSLQPINSVLSEITGTLQYRIDDYGKVVQDKITELQNTAKRAEELFSLEGRFHVFGIVKMDASTSNHFQTNCLKLALRCFTTMLSFEQDESEKEEIFRKGSQLAEEILERAKEIHDRRDLPGYKVRVAEFYISFPNISKEQLSKAENLFESVFPKEYLDQGFGDKVPDRHQLSAGYGLVKCYVLSDRKEEAEKLSAVLKQFPLEM